MATPSLPPRPQTPNASLFSLPHGWLSQSRTSTSTNVQSEFPIDTLGSSLTIRNQIEKRALYRSVGVAIRLLTCPLGMRCMNAALQAPPSLNNESPLALDDVSFSQQVHDCLMAWKREGQFSIIVGTDERGMGWGSTSDSNYGEIKISYELVRTYALTLWRESASSILAENAIFHMAVVILHELAHSVRMWIAENRRGSGVQYVSPGRVRSSDGRGTKSVPDEDRWRGETGWWLEQNLLGGHLLVRRGGMPRITIQAIGLDILPRSMSTSYQLRWGQVDDLRISAIVRGTRGWQSFLPLSEVVERRRGPYPRGWRSRAPDQEGESDLTEAESFGEAGFTSWTCDTRH